ncbi:hypothetical protein F2Z80_12615 [Vibrio fortis]|uniref:Uncharacterized protein n=1 Tax=Vibrio fortis TaxID=212667 RepID=A0A5N3SCT9_9VIBR|nr:hypothetical protein F2P58_15110 [Vibrio fortis]KAB0304708.1 hypothetical protein F2Z80_12615 [Vibrio fortis]
MHQFQRLISLNEEFDLRLHGVVYHQIGKQRTYFTPLFPHSLIWVCAKLIINRAQILQRRYAFDKPYF